MGLKGTKPKRSGCLDAEDEKEADRARLEQAKAAAEYDDSSSEDEYIYVRKKPRKEEKKSKKDGKEKRKKHHRRKRDDDSDDNSSRHRKKRKKHRKRRRRDEHSDDESSSSSSECPDRRGRRRKKRKRKSDECHRDYDKPRARDRIKSMQGELKLSYVSSEAYAGSKDGYFFRSGEEGLGYYRDKPPKVNMKELDEMLQMLKND